MFLRDAVIGPAVVLGSETCVGKLVCIHNSSIGRKCVIGQNSVITNSQIGDQVTIEVCLFPLYYLLPNLGI